MKNLWKQKEKRGEDSGLSPSNWDVMQISDQSGGRRPPGHGELIRAVGPRPHPQDLRCRRLAKEDKVVLFEPIETDVGDLVKSLQTWLRERLCPDKSSLISAVMIKALKP